MKLSKSTPSMMTTSPTQPTNAVGPIESATRLVLPVPAKKISSRVLDGVEDRLGGRQNLIDNLSLCSLDKRGEHLVRLLSDPSRSHEGLSIIARDAGMSASSIMDLLKQASSIKNNTLSMLEVSEALPAVMQDLASKSIDAKVQCPECMGDKLINGTPCIRCNGRGEVFRASDLDRQKVVLEAAGILKKGTGTAIQVNQINNSMSPSNFFSKYVRDSDAAAYDVVDAEIKDGETS